MTSMTNLASANASMYQYSTYTTTITSPPDQSRVIQDRYANSNLLSSVVLSPAQTDRGTTSEDKDNKNSSGAQSAEQLALEKKKKNATAQAAFRARRSNYIANLEETVISLENVVRRLQDACRDSQEDMGTLREENLRLKGLVDGFKQREGIWKAYAKATAGVSVHPGDVPPHSAHTNFSDTPESTTGSLPEGNQNAQLSYTNDGNFYSEPAYPFQHRQDVDPDYTNGFSSSGMQIYTNGLEVDTSSTSSGSKLSPTSSIPPTPTSAVLDVNYSTQSMNLFSGAGSKANYSPAGYAMDSATIQSPDFSTYQIGSSLNLSTGVGSHHRRTLSGPTNDSGAMDMSMYTTEERDSSNSVPATRSSTRSRRNTHAAFPSPLSPPPRASAKLLKSSSVASAASAASGISNTLAVIKAQAFGNVRKTRARAKKSGTGNPREAAKAALEVLEVRGLGLGLDIAGGVKRRRRGEYGAESGEESEEQPTNSA